MLVKIFMLTSLASILWVSPLVCESGPAPMGSRADETVYTARIVPKATPTVKDPIYSEDESISTPELVNSNLAEQKKRFKVITITIPIDSDSTGTDPITIATNEIKAVKADAQKSCSSDESTENVAEEREPELVLIDDAVAPDIHVSRKANSESKPAKKNEQSKKIRTKRSAKGETSESSETSKGSEGSKSSKTPKSKESRKSTKSYEKKDKNKK